MQTFELALTDTYQEILQGGAYVAFDAISAGHVDVYLSETDAVPTGGGNSVQSWPSSWDFSASGVPDNQRVWVRGTGSIRGVRA